MTIMPRLRTPWVLGAAMAALGAAVVLLQDGETDPGPASAAPKAPPGPTFAQPEEASRYHDTVNEGTARAVEVLEEALRAAKAQPRPDPEHIERLEGELAKLRTE